MDHGSAVEKLEGVREIETSLRQDFLALFLIPLEFQRGNLIGVITICNHTCIHAVLSSALSGGIAVSGFVIPAQAGIQSSMKLYSMPACAGMTDKGARRLTECAIARPGRKPVQSPYRASPRPETGAVRALALLASLF
jgi:hypothetical protein